jgi:UDP-glucuronate 4-epimerase
MNRILITGCSGFIGQNFLKYLFNKNSSIEVLGVDRNSSRFTHPSFTFLHTSVQSLTIADLSGVSSILHLAARTGVRQSILEPEDYLEQNVAATVHLLELAIKAHVKRFLFASSSSVYGDTAGRAEGSGPIDSSSCKSFYAFTKQQCEVLTHFYSQTYHLQCVGLRFFTVYGPSPRTDMLIGKVLDCAKSSTPFVFFGNPKNVLRSFTYVDDVASCLFSVLTTKNLPLWSVFNVGNPRSVDCHTILTYLEKELAAFGYTFSIQYREKNLLDSIETRAHINKAFTELQWIPAVDIEEGIHNTVVAEFSNSETMLQEEVA